MTEKNYNPKQKERKSMKKQEKVSKQKTAIETPKKEKKPIKEEQKEKPRTEIKETKLETEKIEAKPEKSETETKKEEPKTEDKTKKEPEKPVPKKTEAVARGKNFDLSTKKSAAICKFIKGKNIEKAIEDLESVLKHKKAVPIKGEIPHRKGRIMSGVYPKKAAENFIKLLKNLSANANVNNLEDPVISEAVANIGSRPYGRFGRFRRKRTHVLIKVKEKKK